MGLRARKFGAQRPQPGFELRHQFPAGRRTLRGSGQGGDLGGTDVGRSSLKRMRGAPPAFRVGEARGHLIEIKGGSLEEQIGEFLLESGIAVAEFAQPRAVEGGEAGHRRLRCRGSGLPVGEALERGDEAPKREWLGEKRNSRTVVDLGLDEPAVEGIAEEEDRYPKGCGSEVPRQRKARHVRQPSRHERSRELHVRAHRQSLGTGTCDRNEIAEPAQHRAHQTPA